MGRRGWARGACVSLCVLLAACGDPAVRKGDEALARQDFDAAISAYTKALAEHPDDLDVRYRLVDAYVQQINFARGQESLPLPELEKAVEEVHQIIEPVKDSQPDLSRALVQLHFSLARNYGEAQMPEKAREQWEIIVGLQPSALAYFNIGHSCTLLADWECAVSAYQKAIEMDEFLTDAYKGLGNAYIQLRRDADAAGAYRKALEIEPLDTSIRYNLGIALKRTGDLDGAITEFGKAIEQDPEYALPYRGLRDTWELKGDMAKAEEWDRKWREVAGLEAGAEDEGAQAEPSAAETPATQDEPMATNAESGQADQPAAGTGAETGAESAG